MPADMVFRYPVSSLLERLQANREKHIATHQEAVEGWYEAVAEEAQKGVSKVGTLFRRAQSKDTDLPVEITKYNFHVSSPYPADHTDDYDRVIDMLQLTSAKEIELDENQFRQYVRDEWSWSGQFNTLSASYSNKKR